MRGKRKKEKEKKILVRWKSFCFRYVFLMRLSYIILATACVYRASSPSSLSLHPAVTFLKLELLGVLFYLWVPTACTAASTREKNQKLVIA